MPWSSRHLKWLVDTGERLKTIDGKIVEIWELRHKKDDELLSLWARHFRNHYCRDAEIDFLRNGTGYSRKEYLERIKFPDVAAAPGPSIRSGDFGEILVADYLQYLLGYWVPRSRYANKAVRNESTKGCDIIGFKFLNNGKDENDDIMAIFESKAQFSGTRATPRLQLAVDGSAKDLVRKAESLNAIKQDLFNHGLLVDAKKVERFQNLEDRPYHEVYGAVALFSTEVFDKTEIAKTKTKTHPFSKELFLIVIRGDTMMYLVHELYRRAADEA
ncbi:MAG: SAVED domain-containing protein [Candidatus Omnitrophica bacterium]|nr:SAVED domain-containing protein [Candidatus Omnitrophota bacterium]